MIKARWTATAASLLLFSFVHISVAGAGEVSAKSRRRLGVRSLCSSLLAGTLVGGAALYHYERWNQVLGRENYQRVTKIIADRSRWTLGLLEEDGVAVFEIKDETGNIPSISFNLGDRGVGYKRRLFQFLDPSFGNEETLSPLIVFQIKAFVFVTHPEDPEFVDVYLRFSEIDRDVKVPVPLKLSDIQDGNQAKRIRLTGKDVETKATGEMGIEFRFLPTEKAISVHRIHLNFVIPPIGFRKLKFPPIPIKKKIEGVAAYRSPHKEMLKILEVPEAKVFVESVSLD
jgi:hypothetical protein